jgi:hypothetical protein
MDARNGVADATSTFGTFPSAAPLAASAASTRRRAPSGARSSSASQSESESSTVRDVARARARDPRRETTGARGRASYAANAGVASEVDIAIAS